MYKSNHELLYTELTQKLSDRDHKIRNLNTILLTKGTKITQLDAELEKLTRNNKDLLVF